MVVDPSALVAYLKGEPEADRLETAMLDAESLHMSAASWVEAGIVADSLRGDEGGRRLDALLDRLRVEIVPLTQHHAEIARSAYQRYGKCRHRARLNLGDCFSYALARARGATPLRRRPLLTDGRRRGSLLNPNSVFPSPAFMSLSTVIKSIQNIMRKDVGVDGDAQRIGQLGWMLFLKIFDDREQERTVLEDDYRSPVPPDLQWRQWAADPEGITGDALLAFVNDRLFPALKELPLTGKPGDPAVVVRGVFEDAYNYMKSGTLLRQVINKINEIDFNRTSDRHLFNDLYEQILKDLQSAGNAGEYYTPRAVTRFMVERVGPKLGEQVLDPACGTGGFLVNTLEYLRQKYVKTPDQEAEVQASVHGVEKKPLPHLLCTTNLLLHGLDVPTQVRRDNTLTRPLRDYGPRDRVEVIVTNPPFGGEEEQGIESNFPQMYQTRETADLFLVLIMHLLKDGGRAAVVLPDGFLFGEGVKSRIKERLLADCDLHTIVRLPKGVFAPYTGINTNLLFFTKGRATKEVWYYEHPYPEGQKSYSKTRPIRIEEFEAESAWWDSREENEQAWKVSAEEIVKRGYNLDIKNPNAEGESHRDPDELLAEYRAVLAEVQETRDKLKRELGAALEKALVAEVKP